MANSGRRVQWLTEAIMQSEILHMASIPSDCSMGRPRVYAACLRVRSSVGGVTCII